MKLLLSLSLLLFHCIGFSQASAKDVQVEYQAFYNTASPKKMLATLYVSGNVAVYQEKEDTREEWAEKAKPEEVKPGTHVTVTKGALREDGFYRIDRNKKEVLFYDYIARNQFLIKDTYPEIKWAITDETKTVAGLQCIKAVGDFRGRQWIAWFAPEVPLAFGPWKLQGLPGIILEAYDSTNTFAMKAVKLEYNKGDMVSKDFSKIYKTANASPISYEKFLEEREEAINNFYNQESQALAAKGGSITRNVAPRSGQELKFEWEE